MTWQPDGWNDDMSEAPKDGTFILLGIFNDPQNMAAARWNGYYWDMLVPEREDVHRFDREFGAPDAWRYLPSPPSKQED